MKIIALVAYGSGLEIALKLLDRGIDDRRRLDEARVAQQRLALSEAAG
jgi:hypothetical protein